VSSNSHGIADKFRDDRPFLAAVATLTAGSVISQLVPLVAAPLLTRLYSPMDYGELAVFTAVCGLLATVATATYEQAIVLPKSDEDAASLAALTVTLAAIVSMMASLVLFFGGARLRSVLGSPAGATALWLAPLAVFVGAVSRVLTMWLTRKQQFSRITLSNLVQTSAGTASNISFGIANCGGVGLITGGILGQLASAAALANARNVRSDIHLAVGGGVAGRAIAQARIFSNFPRFHLPQVVLDISRDSAIVFLLLHSFGTATLGSYSFAMRILRMPLVILGSAIGQVTYQDIAARLNSGTPVWPRLRRTVGVLSLVALGPFLVLLFLGPDLFELVFGQRWRHAGTLVQCLSPWLMVNFVSSPLSQVPLALNRQKEYLLIGLGYDLLVPGTLLVATSLSWSVVPALWCMSLSAAVYLVGTTAWFAAISRRCDA